MKTFRVNKKVIMSLSLILMLSLSLLVPFIQTSNAQVGVPQPVKTVGYISVAPTVVGVGQEPTVNLWVFPMPTNYLYRPYFKGFEGITVTFVKPDGSKDTFMPVSGTHQYEAGQTEALGGIFFNYKPDVAGEWSVTFTMPPQNLTDKSGTVLYQGCTSNSFDFTVTEEEQLAGLLNGYPWLPVPDDDVYWSYPINSNNRDWSQISGDWLQGGSGTAATLPSFLGVTCKMWQPYGSAPNTPHIVWSQALKLGGLMGGDYGSISYLSGTAGGRSEIVIAGKVFVNIPSAGEFECIDLVTGEIMYKATGSVTCGIRLPGNAYSQNAIVDGVNNNVVLANSFGAIPTTYLWGSSGSTWNYYDPFTGKVMRSIVNCSSATLVDSTNLAFGASRGNLYAWNMSKVVGNNWPTGVEWSIPLPVSLLGTSPSLMGISTDVSTLVLKTANQYWGYSAIDGTQLWNFTLNYPVNQNQQIAMYGVDDFVIFDPVAASFHCYSMKTGAELWESDSYSDSPWATTWTVYGSMTNDYNNVYFILPDGTVSALNLITGDEVWRSEPYPSTEFTNNAVPYVVGVIMVGGNIYVYAGYSLSYQLDPVPRFAMMTCINATTGENTYALNGGIFPSAASNGYILGQGNYDGILYCIGKGQTSTSVTIQNDVVTNHATVLIKGNVLDQSPAQAGTPAVADSAMSEWMDYLNMQNATLLNNPPKPEGVPVTLTAVDPNGNTITIGTTTTNSEGNYAIKFNPENVGTYAITASFAGSDSYWPSDSQAMMEVIAGSEATPTPVTQTTTDNTMLLYGILVAVIIAIVIGLFALFRKR